MLTALFIQFSRERPLKTRQKTSKWTNNYKHLWTKVMTSSRDRSSTFWTSWTPVMRVRSRWVTPGTTRRSKKMMRRKTKRMMMMLKVKRNSQKKKMVNLPGRMFWQVKIGYCSSSWHRLKWLTSRLRWLREDDKVCSTRVQVTSVSSRQ